MISRNSSNLFITFQPRRHLAIRQRLKSVEQKCRSLRHIHRSARTAFFKSHEILA